MNFEKILNILIEKKNLFSVTYSQLLKNQQDNHHHHHHHSRHKKYLLMHRNVHDEMLNVLQRTDVKNFVNMFRQFCVTLRKKQYRVQQRKHNKYNYLVVSSKRIFEIKLEKLIKSKNYWTSEYNQIKKNDYIGWRGYLFDWKKVENYLKNML